MFGRKRWVRHVLILLLICFVWFLLEFCTYEQGVSNSVLILLLRVGIDIWQLLQSLWGVWVRLEMGQFTEGKIGVQGKPREGACSSVQGCHKSAEIHDQVVFLMLCGLNILYSIKYNIVLNIKINFLLHGKEMQKSEMAVWGGLTNSCEKKRSEKQRRKGKI